MEASVDDAKTLYSDFEVEQGRRLFAQECNFLLGIDKLAQLPVCSLPEVCLLYTSPSPRDRTRSRMPSSA